MMDLKGIANRAASAALDTENVQPEISQKMQNINEYKNATKPTFSAEPVRDNSPSMKDKIAPKARYGARHGEQRIETAPMTKPLGSFEKGTDSVPKTGVYKLHKGEAVIPKDKNPMKQVDKAMASSKDMMGDDKKPKKAIKHIETRKTHDGKFVHTHKHHHPDVHKDEEHVSNNMDELKKHMDAHMGGEPDGDEAGAGAPAQMTAQAPPMPAAPAAGAGPMPGAM
jgi:hypothetical protein